MTPKQTIQLSLIVIFIGMAVAISLMTAQLQANRKELQRKTQNIETLNSNYKSYKNSYGQSVTSINALTYTIDEFKHFQEKDAQTISELKIKAKNVKEVVKVETITNTIFKEKLVYSDSTTCFDFSDGYTSINACLNKDSIAGKFTNKDSLFIAVSTEHAKKFLWFKYGYKISGVTAKYNNPNTEIIGLEFIEIKKN